MPEDEIIDFFENPNFEISNLSYLAQNQTFPTDKAREAWDGVVLPFILISKQHASRKYFEAKNRYHNLVPLLTRSWPLLYLVLAEAHFWLSDYHETYDLLTKLSGLIGPDEKLSKIILLINGIIKMEAAHDEEHHNKKGSTFTCTFQTPFSCPLEPSDDKTIQQLFQRWENLQNKESEALQQFIRLACIATNVIEDVFQFEGQTWPKLIRRGFYVNSIDGISQISKKKKKETVIQILKNTQESLQYISECLNDSNNFTTDFIKKIHATLLKNDNIDEEQDEGITVYRLICTGKFRKVACIVTHQDETEVTQYCHHSDIDSEMASYCEKARDMLENETINPFMKAAWLQWAFLRIHPFEDGNGRVSRIISSIPLTKLHLPPIVVTSEHKPEYFQALHRADREYDLKPLSLFLCSSLVRAMAEIENLPSDESFGKGSGGARSRARPGTSRKKTENSGSSGSDSGEQTP